MRFKDRSTCKLDLHGLTYEEAGGQCHKFINKYWLSNCEGQIITGNSISMKEVVIKIINQYKLDFQVGSLNNFGIIRVWFE